MTSKYEIIIYWSNDDNCFIAEVPELAGCMVIDEWIETAQSLNRTIPIPKGKLAFA